MSQVALSKLFRIEYGLVEYENKSGLNPGNTPVISSKGTDNGCYGFFDVPAAYKAPVITVPRTGTIGHAFVQLEDCSPNSDCLVLVPLTDMEMINLYEVAQQIRDNKWRYQYGRKITPMRLGKQIVDINLSKTSYQATIKQIRPKAIPAVKLSNGFVIQEIEKLFSVNYGQIEYESKKYLEPGNTALISSKGDDNGYYGFYEIPAKYSAPIITVPRTGTIAKAYVQEFDCCVDSNCLVLNPLKAMRIELLQSVAFQIRSNKWRYMYGRQITPERLRKQLVAIPTLS